MSAFIGFTAEVYNPDVKLVTQNSLDCIKMKHFSTVSCYTKFLEETSKIGKRAFAFGEKLKCFFDNFGFYRINLDCSQSWFVKITIRCFIGQDSLAEFLSVSAFYVFA
ncbi:hypothetical protein A2Z00_05505 [Candidatus Gottesmanbacteria bacterium RBG_13_45_10]|uniref:Uncharacterized protein n=1 Tax=Candidatus Gottesmanbacteria bacterium RBG_13_45_10 TaxID=1798370 RepID=A0A1F5ZFM9_9BACT|nr:MAG: hypothetical protein A2Z00_05505 [Candidatus Gottesmanbacteria bacterium RBG_13_45_10]